MVRRRKVVLDGGPSELVNEIHFGWGGGTGKRRTEPVKWLRHVDS